MQLSQIWHADRLHRFEGLVGEVCSRPFKAACWSSWYTTDLIMHFAMHACVNHVPVLYCCGMDKRGVLPVLIHASHTWVPGHRWQGHLRRLAMTWRRCWAKRAPQHRAWAAWAWPPLCAQCLAVSLQTLHGTLLSHVLFWNLTVLQVILSAAASSCHGTYILSAQFLLTCMQTHDNVALRIVSSIRLSVLLKKLDFCNHLKSHNFRAAEVILLLIAQPVATCLQTLSRSPRR